MKKSIIIIVSLTLAIVSNAQNYIGTVNTPSTNTPLMADGVWEWVSTLSGNTSTDSVIAKFINLSTLGGKTSAKATMSANKVKARCTNWILGTQTFSDANWISTTNFHGIPTTGYYEIAAGGFTNRNSSREVTAYKKYYLQLAKPKDGNDYTLYGVILEISWDKPTGGSVTNQGGTAVVYKGIWINKSKQNAANVSPKTPPKYYNINLQNNTQGIQTNIGINANLRLPLSIANEYFFSIDAVEALAVDDNKCGSKDASQAEYIFDMGIEIKKNNTRLAFVPDIIQAIHGKPGGYGYPINNGLELSKPFSLNNKLYSFNIDTKDFNTISFNFTGLIAEVTMCNANDFPYKDPIELINTKTPHTVLLKNMKAGKNSIVLEKNGKKIKIHYTINP